VIIVTHDVRVIEFGDRIARMEDGHIISVDERAREAGARELSAAAGGV
jgi:ABC-type lipoprotein export system ATPase subunit